MSTPEAQRKARKDYRDRRREAGDKLASFMLSADALAALEQLAKVHGSKAQAVNAALIEAARQVGAQKVSVPADRLDHLLAALDICTKSTTRQWANAEAAGYHIAEALGLPDHDVTAEQARAVLGASEQPSPPSQGLKGDGATPQKPQAHKTPDKTVKAVSEAPARTAGAKLDVPFGPTPRKPGDLAKKGTRK